MFINKPMSRILWHTGLDNPQLITFSVRTLLKLRNLHETLTSTYTAWSTPIANTINKVLTNMLTAVRISTSAQSWTIARYCAIKKQFLSRTKHLESQASDNTLFCRLLVVSLLTRGLLYKSLKEVSSLID